MEELLQSWVYKKTARKSHKRQFSVGTVDTRVASWPMISGVSLSQISNVAVVMLPICGPDISNSSLYEWGEQNASSDKVNLEKVIMQGLPGRRRTTAIMGIAKGVVKAKTKLGEIIERRT
jgi:hypothetical protein